MDPETMVPASLEDDVARLLDRMTPAEKLAQLGSAWAFALLDEDGHLDPDHARETLGQGIGQITRPGGSTRRDPVAVASLVNEMQRFLVEETRLGIPAIFHEETLHGVLASGAPIFQQSIGAAATWDPDLVEAVSGTIRRRMLLMGARHALAPVLDITNDPRWGRIEETYGEDPYLAMAMGVAYVRGLQTDDLEQGVLATGKHLVGHGIAEGGLNQAPVHLGHRELHDEQLLPFEAAVRIAGLASVMPAYCELDGVPCHGSHHLLTDILRDAWGFDGVVVSDYMGIEQIAAQHRLTSDMSEAAAMAIAAGVDMDLPRTDAYGAPLAKALRDGRIDPSAVDAAVARVLRIKFRLGLFGQPYIDAPTADVLEALEAEERDLARRLAARSIVLLENDGVLPLRPQLRRVAVVGPIAASERDLLGDYSHLVHMETLADPQNVDIIGAVFNDTGPHATQTGPGTIVDALRDRLGTQAVGYARGTGLVDGTDDELETAVALVASSDVAILVLGERSGLTDDSTTGEFRDRRGLGFLGRQQELLERAVETGTPVILVVVSGRPLALSWAATHCSAVILAWVPGDAGPAAIADVLTGVESPGGKLPVTMLRDVGQVPLTYRHHPSGGRSNPRGDHVDGAAGPQWPFGHGLSYTTFSLSDLALDRESLSTDQGEVTVRVRVTNTGERAGDEVIQLYARDEQADVARPVLELCGFARVSLAARESADLFFALHVDQLSHTGLGYKRIVEAGDVTLSVGTSSADRPLSVCVRLVGPEVEVRERRRFLTPVSVRRETKERATELVT